jgi:transcription initiation factor IIE alpha subunit
MSSDPRLKWYVCPQCGERCDWFEGNNLFACPRCGLNVHDTPAMMRRWVEHLTHKLDDLVTIMAGSEPVEREVAVLEHAIRQLMNRLWQVRDAQNKGAKA